MISGGIAMNEVILGCSSMAKAIDAAQKKTGTDHPVYLISRKYHSSPGQMRLHLMEALHTIPESSDTVLVAMGFCGGSWKDIDTEKRIVIPKVDDCITLMLHTDDSPHFNLKQATHLYMRDPYGDDFGSMHEKLRMKYGEEKGDATFARWFEPFTDLDIIDAGIYDCHSSTFIDKARRDAQAIGCRLNHIKGSNIIMEKLVSGKWDSQFIVNEPHRPLSEENFR